MNKELLKTQLQEKLFNIVAESYNNISSNLLIEAEDEKNPYDTVEVSLKRALDYVAENTEVDLSNLDDVIIEAARTFRVSSVELEDTLVEAINAQRNKLIRVAGMKASRHSVEALKAELRRILNVRKQTGNPAYGRGQEDMIRQKIFDARHHAYGKTKSQGVDVPGVKI